MPMTTDQIALVRQKIADIGTDAVQSIQIENAIGGTWTATFNGQTTSVIPYNAGANVVQNALVALSTVGLGNVGVYTNPGEPSSVFYVVELGGTLGRLPQPMLTIDVSGLTGVGVLGVVSQVVAGGITAFSDTELSANYDLALGNFFLGIAYDFDDLLANAAKFNDYTAGQTQEKKSQITANLRERSAWYHQWANASRQIQMASLTPEPPRERAVPWTPGTPIPSLTYAYRRNRWGGGWS